MVRIAAGRSIVGSEECRSAQFWDFGVAQIAAPDRVLIKLAIRYIDRVEGWRGGSQGV